MVNGSGGRDGRAGLRAKGSTVITWPRSIMSTKNNTGDRHFVPVESLLLSSIAFRTHVALAMTHICSHSYTGNSYYDSSIAFLTLVTLTRTHICCHSFTGNSYYDSYFAFLTLAALALTHICRHSYTGTSYYDSYLSLFLHW